MTTIQAIVLGIIQGLTEFLPISSSGHLVIFPFFMNWHPPEKEMFIFNVLVQMGTLVAVIIYFYKDLLAIITDFFRNLFKGTPFATKNARTGWLLIIATIPAGMAGIFLKDLVEKTFGSPLFVGIALIVTAVLMILAEKVNLKIKKGYDITLIDALIIGLFQSLAIFPGLSRSGLTISGGMTRHIKRKPAARFSFLMSIPIMLAAGALSGYQMVTQVPNLGDFLPVMIIGFLTSMIVGYVAIRWLLKFLSNHSLTYFSIYCFLIGTLTIVISQVR
jgi:undecaprenyl-diphosphatase